jgi:ABC-type glutathione transport system ATPase component
MRQRLGIAAALLGDPPVNMLDEPFNGMDPEGIVWIRGFLRSLAAQGRTVLVSSHPMSELQDTADHLVVIGRGRLIADTSVTDLIAATSSGRVTLRTTARSEATTVLANADATVAPPDRPSRPPPACAACPSVLGQASVCSPPGPPPRSWPAADCSGCETREPGPAMTIPSPHYC